MTTSNPAFPPDVPLTDESGTADGEAVGSADRDADVARSRGEDPADSGRDGTLAGDIEEHGLLGSGSDAARDGDGVPVGQDDARADAARTGADPDQV
jgi:hypothetical protein